MGGKKGLLGALLGVGLAIFLGPGAFGISGLGILSAGQAVLFGISAIGSALMAAKLDKQRKQDDPGFLVNKQSTQEPLYVIYGDREVGGHRIFVDTTDDGHPGNPVGTQYLHMAFAICEGEIDAIKAIRFNDRLVYLNNYLEDPLTADIPDQYNEEFDTHHILIENDTGLVTQWYPKDHDDDTESINFADKIEMAYWHGSDDQYFESPDYCSIVDGNGDPDMSWAHRDWFNYKQVGAEGLVSGRVYDIYELGNTDWTAVGNTSTTAGSLTPGNTYIITSLGDTDFEAIGANYNTVGAVFTATGAGSGTGTVLNFSFTATGAGTGTGTAIDLSGDGTTEGDSSRRGRGVAWCYLMLTYDRKAFSSAPRVTFEVRGRKIADVVDTTDFDSLTFAQQTARMTNPANCIADYISNSRYGKGLTAASTLDTGSGSSFANYKQYCIDKGITFNGAINTNNTIFDTVQDMMASGNAFMNYSNGVYKIHPNDELDFTDAYTFTKDNILGTVNIELGNKRGMSNIAKGSFFDKDKRYQQDTVVIPKFDETNQYLIDDNNTVSEATFSLNYIHDKETAEKLTRFQLDNSRFMTTMMFQTTWAASNLEVGDPVYVTYDRYGFTNKKFRLVGQALQADGTVFVTLVEYPTTDIWIADV